MGAVSRKWGVWGSIGRLTGRKQYLRVLTGGFMAFEGV